MSVSAILTPAGLTVNFDDGPRMLRKDASEFAAAIEAWRANDKAKLLDIMNPRQTMLKFTEGNISFDDSGAATYRGSEISNYVITKILELKAANLPWRPLAKFLDRLMANPSSRAVAELYRFLETENLPITDDGHFLAYKRVRENWLDFHSGKISNKIGESPSMPRNEVDDDFNHGCSHGLHAGSLAYVAGFNSGGHLIIVKIDPADVVSIPKEDVRKLRTCRYTVMKEMDSKLVDGPLYSGKTASVINVVAVEDDIQEEDHLSEYDEDLDAEDDLDTPDFDVDEVLNELLALATKVVGMPVAVDRPLRRIMNDDEIEEFCDFIEVDFDVYVGDEDFNSVTLETLADSVINGLI